MLCRPYLLSFPLSTETHPSHHDRPHRSSPGILTPPDTTRATQTFLCKVRVEQYGPSSELARFTKVFQVT